VSFFFFSFEELVVVFRGGKLPGLRVAWLVEGTDGYGVRLEERSG
jgi:hypothetical protein